MKKPHPLPKSPPNTLTLLDAQEQAQRLYTKGAYKEAIEAYKRLLKQENRPEWKNQLVMAYLERARQLAAKRMYKEAAVLWENRDRVSPQTADPSQWEYIEWLLLAGRHEQAAQRYLKFEAEFTANPEAKNIPVIFSALLLAGDPVLTSILTNQPFWRNQLALAEQALTAYCREEPADQVEALLKQIPFRSPFRDFRTLLKAMLLLEQEGPEAAAAMGAKIPPGSPYAVLMRLLPTNRPSPLTLPPSEQQPFMAALYGWDTPKIQVLQELQALATQGERPLFNYLLRQHATIGTQDIQQALQQWLPHLTPQHLKQYEHQFGFDSLGIEEHQRLSTLMREITQPGQVKTIDSLWKNHLNQRLEALEHGDNALQAALIQRHRVELMQRSGYDDPQHLATLLHESLQWDPYDKTAQLQYIDLCKRPELGKAQYHAAIDQALQRYPRDVDILLKAVSAAQQRKAFKKVVGYAQRILEIDSINTQAREVLIASHLAHAHKLLKQQKFPGATKELDSASQYERGEPSMRLRVNRALLAYATQDTTQALELLKPILAIHGHCLPLYAIIHLEATPAGLAPEQIAPTRLNNKTQTLLSALAKTQALLPALTQQYAVTTDEAISLIRHIKPYLPEQTSTVQQLLHQWQRLLLKIAPNYKERAALTELCQFFKQIEDFTLLAQYAEVALRHWEQSPLFVFYQIYAKAKGKYHHVSYSDDERLEAAMGQARQSDPQAEALIRDFVRNYHRRSRSLPSPRQTKLPPEQQLIAIQAEVEALINTDMNRLFDLLEAEYQSTPSSPTAMMEIVSKIMTGGQIMMILLLLDKKGKLPPNVDLEDLARHFNKTLLQDDEIPDNPKPRTPKRKPHA